MPKPTQPALFSDKLPAREVITAGAVLLRGYALDPAPALLHEVDAITKIAPFRHMITPGGFRMSVAMTNCGQAGWVSDRKGYRYDPIDPERAAPWPPMPALFADLARKAAAEAGFPNFETDVCLINRYAPGTKLSLHQDKDEHDFTAPIVTVSLGLSAVFLFGGLTRKERPRRIQVNHGDVVIWGGEARLAYHGIAPLPEGDHPLPGPYRISLTFRKAR